MIVAHEVPDGTRGQRCGAHSRLRGNDTDAHVSLEETPSSLDGECPTVTQAFDTRGMREVREWASCGGA